MPTIVRGARQQGGGAKGAKERSRDASSSSSSSEDEDSEEEHSYRGVSRISSREASWEVKIGYDGEQHYIGVFGSAREAAEAYDAAARKHHGANARLNFPDRDGKS